MIQQVLVREKDPAIYYEYWIPRQTALYRMTVDAFASDAQHVVSARPTQAPTLVAPTTTTRPIIRRTTTGRTTTVHPTTTASSPVFQQHNATGQIDWDQYEPQPTAASLVRSPPRMTYGHIFAPFFNPQTTTTTTTSTTTQRTTTIPTKKSRSNKKNIDQVRQHLGLIHKKHPKSVRSGNSNHGQLSCSIDGSCWKTVNGKKHFCLSEFGIYSIKILMIKTET